MRRHWKDLAERSAKAAFSPDQVSEALPHALKKEILSAPIKEIRDIMDSDTLFPELRIERLDALRQAHRSAAATHVIDCTIAAAASGLTGEVGTHAALQNALQDTTRNALRGIEEHYQREASSRSAGYVRTRLDAASRQLDCGALARELLTPGTPPSPRSVTLPRQSGVDEGPSL
ncbi:hypothetical protein [Bradyrhizobium sp. CCBAU 45384]|uniref:hypothetical protein n=1 Tax=Bradyrhizobium sp. CCBAU 45384 TaxID=858428 RepID=UPI002306B8C7|nr:hypothetical protein [Bradyrhizobium sp. CCBAU 45384]MDA9409814.1 hypothetical protein [Bradyrhizobium sp. CCBAU 45384]